MIEVSELAQPSVDNDPLRMFHLVEAEIRSIRSQEARWGFPTWGMITAIGALGKTILDEIRGFLSDLYSGEGIALSVLLISIVWDTIHLSYHSTLSRQNWRESLTKFRLSQEWPTIRLKFVVFMLRHVMLTALALYLIASSRYTAVSAATAIFYAVMALSMARYGSPLRRTHRSDRSCCHLA